jgi:hypothetical protein
MAFKDAGRYTMWTQFWKKTRKTTLTELVPWQKFSSKLCRGRKTVKQGAAVGLGAAASGGRCVPWQGLVWLRATLERQCLDCYHALDQTDFPRCLVASNPGNANDQTKRALCLARSDRLGDRWKQYGGPSVGERSAGPLGLSIQRKERAKPTKHARPGFCGKQRSLKTPKGRHDRPRCLVGSVCS